MLRRACVLGFAAIAAAAAPTASAFLAAPLPMIGQFIPTAHGVPASIRFSGRVPTAAAGEKVTIFGRSCGYRYYRQITGTRTLRGGGWEAEVGGSFGRPGDMETGMTYRARWKGRWSVPFTFRWRMHPVVRRVAEGRFRVEVAAEPAIDLRRKPVALQRRAGDEWVTSQTQRLRLVPETGGRLSSAAFTVRTRGLTMRALVPLATARPCYNPGISESFRS